jgi:hypothetical protein
VILRGKSFVLLKIALMGKGYITVTQKNEKEE